MKKFSVLAALMIPLALGLTACGSGPREDMGTIVGAVAGGAIGNQFGKGDGKVAATIAGIVIGGIVGSDIGRSLDENDRRRASELPNLGPLKVAVREKPASGAIPIAVIMVGSLRKDLIKSVTAIAAIIPITIYIDGATRGNAWTGLPERGRFMEPFELTVTVPLDLARCPGLLGWSTI